MTRLTLEAGASVVVAVDRARARSDALAELGALDGVLLDAAHPATRPHTGATTTASPAERCSTQVQTMPDRVWKPKPHSAPQTRHVCTWGSGGSEEEGMGACGGNERGGQG